MSQTTPEKDDNKPTSNFQVFKGLPNSQYISKTGESLSFDSEGRLLTKIPSVIRELQNEIDLNHPMFSRDEEITDAEAAPIEALKQTLRAEIMAELAAASMDQAIKPNAGYYTPPPLNVASTLSMAPMSAEEMRARSNVAMPLASQPDPVVMPGQGVNISVVSPGTEATEVVKEDGSVMNTHDGVQTVDTSTLDDLVAGK